MFPTTPRPADAEILKLDFRRDRGRRNRRVDKPQTRQRRFYELRKQVFRAKLYQPRRLGNNFGLSRIRANRKDPARAIEAALIENVAVTKISPRQNQRNLNAIRWHDQLEMRADMLIQRAETLLQIIVVVRWQGFGM